MQEASPLELLTAEDVDLRLDLRGKFHDVVAIESVRGFAPITPCKIFERCFSLRGRRLRIGAVIHHKERGRERGGARVPRIRRILPGCARDAVLVQNPCRGDELSRTHGPSVSITLPFRYRL